MFVFAGLLHVPDGVQCMSRRTSVDQLLNDLHLFGMRLLIIAQQYIEGERRTRSAISWSISYDFDWC